MPKIILNSSNPQANSGVTNFFANTPNQISNPNPFNSLIKKSEEKNQIQKNVNQPNKGKKREFFTKFKDFKEQ
jgi:mannose-6-phosphate isomerase class I